MVHVIVSNANDTKTWENDISKEDYDKIKKYEANKADCWALYGMIIPIRTNNLKNLATDFFLPTTLNYAVKLEDFPMIVKIIAIVAAILVDLLTLPLRCLTVIPRMIYNAMGETSEMYQYLSDAGVDKDLLNEDFVKMRFEWSDKKSKSWQQYNYSFIDLPGYDHKCHSSGVSGSF